MNPCGEVYLPPAVMDAASSLSTQARGLLFDAIHLLHAYRPVGDLVDAPLINTAHVRGWRQHELMPGPKKLILLTRDPLDVVLSRTFRKQTYRTRHFGHEDDETYLRRNIDFVRGFYERGRTATPDAQVRYEELRHDAPATIKTLGQALDTRLDGVATGAAVGHQKSNKYAGPQVDIPAALVDIAVSELTELRRDLGYQGTNETVGPD